MRHSPRLSLRLWTIVAAIVFNLKVPSMCEAGETPRRLQTGVFPVHKIQILFQQLKIIIV